ncbi:hypothetical protein [Paenibacillus daejeonensis]|uniref:hypothetical protein n=1 Tax=Paenibacillus daejeonensis TaxID=135193 RepID=UPI00037DA790|nr:hypothetical protein [Paenibacillus daejeonensis]
MQTTGNLNLKKPEGTDIVDINDLNDNMDILDSEVSRVASPTVNGRMAAADKAKLNGIAASANNYVHPANHPASIITQDASNRFVTDAEKAAWNAKAGSSVATTSANGLMSSGDKSKLDGIAAGANNYVHPANHPASIISQDANNRFVSDTEKAAWNAKAGTSVATTGANGLMSSGDKSKLDGITAGAQPNTVTSVAGRTGAVALTKTDVGLASVQNYAVATQAQAEAGTASTAYMTPQRTKQAIDKLTGSVPMRLQNGQLEYFDGTRWFSMGSENYSPIEVINNFSDMTPSIWRTIWEVSGEGELSVAVIDSMYSDHSLAIEREIRIKIDGVVTLYSTNLRPNSNSSSHMPIGYIEQSALSYATGNNQRVNGWGMNTASPSTVSRYGLIGDLAPRLQYPNVSLGQGVSIGSKPIPFKSTIHVEIRVMAQHYTPIHYLIRGALK